MVGIKDTARWYRIRQIEGVGGQTKQRPQQICS